MPRATKFLAPLATMFMLAGCEMPIPSSIGLEMVDEVDMSVKDFALASLLSERCAESGFESEDITHHLDKLSPSQRLEFDDYQSDSRHRREIDDSVNRTACSDHASTFRRIKSKSIVINE